MRRIGTWLAVASLVGTITSVGAWAQAPGGASNEGHPRGPGEGRPPMRLQPGAGSMQPGQGWMKEMALARIVNDAALIAQIGLSEDQVKALKASADQLKTKREELQKELVALETQQAKMMEEATVDEKAVLAGLEKASQIRMELEKTRIQHLLLIKKTLTPEQSAKVKEMTEQRMRGGAGPRGETRKESDKPAPPAAPAP